MLILIIYLIIILFKYKNNTLKKEWTQYNLDCCCFSVAKPCLTLWNHLDCSTPGSSVFHYLPEFAQIHVHWVGGWFHLIISSSAASSLLPSAFPFGGSFQRVGSSHYVNKVLELQLQHQYFKWISGMISFRTDWFDVLSVHGGLKSLFQHHNSIQFLVLSLVYGRTHIHT